MRPEPTSVRYNDWRQVDVPPADAFEPVDPVSVVVPYYQTPRETEKTLAALEGQSYPRELFEVVVVDDGSQSPFEAPEASPLPIKVVRQRRRGFGLARARNLGARTAAHDILLFLDGDMLPEAGWIAAHARWHHRLLDVLTVGIRKSVATNDVSADAIRERQGSLAELYSSEPVAERWVERHLLRTNDLTSIDDEPFSAVVGAHFGIRKAFYHAIGGSNEDFRRWGVEDVELGYRAYAHGGLLVPVRDATAWHQGVDMEGQVAKQASNTVNRGIGAHRIPHHNYRSATPGRSFAVPEYVVTLDASRLRADQAVRAVAKLLADPVHDLVVRVELGPTDGDRLEYVRNELAPDPRVRLNPSRTALDEFPVSTFHVELPGEVVFARGLIDRMRAGLGDAVQVRSAMRDGSCLSMTRGWALHRARRTGLAPVAFGDGRLISGDRLRAVATVRDPGDEGEQVPTEVQGPAEVQALAAIQAPAEIVPYPARRDAVLENVRHLRSLDGVLRLARRAVRWGWWRLATAAHWLAARVRHSQRTRAHSAGPRRGQAPGG